MAASSNPSADQQTPPPAKHRLRLKGLIGKGAFGSIYKGVLDGEVVAVKTLSQNRNQESQQSGDASLDDQMFFREAEMLKACQHRRIIGFRHLLRMPPADSKSKEPMWALVMEYAKNGNLGQRVAQQMTQPGRSSYSNMQAMSWALDIASSLEYLHMRVPAVFHRDVKSANIMLAAEEGSDVAKLSDFGLHVTADDSKHRALQSSGYSTSVATNSALLRSSSSTASRLQDSSSRTNSSSNSSGLVAPPGLPPAAAPAPAAAAVAAAAADTRSLNDIYSEVHDSGGRRTYVQQQPAAAAATAGAIAQATRNLMARRNSFRRANHHPPGEALPRLANSSGAVGLGFGSFSDPESAADANARLFAHMRSVVDGSSAGGSMSSIVTDGTWAKTETVISGTDTAGSDCTDDTAGSIFEEVETVFNMTGRTGSCLYMAPEVYQGKQYNEKSDVFSFGVVLYELMSRVLVVFTELPTNSNDPELPQLYAEKVAGGYRPSRPKTKYMTDDMWALISACWHQDPLLRPHMSEVVAVLSKAVTDEAARQLTSRSSRTSFSFSGRRNSMQLQAPPTAGAARRAASISGPPGGGGWAVNAFARQSAPLQSVGVPGCEDSAAGSDPDTNKAAARVPAIDEDCCDDDDNNNEELNASAACTDNTAAAAAVPPAACSDDNNNNNNNVAATAAGPCTTAHTNTNNTSQGCCVIC